MKKYLRVLVLVAFFIILFSPNTVFAEERPELKWKQEDGKADVAYRGNTVIASSDEGYFVINNANEIILYNYDGKKIKTIIENFSDHIRSAVVDGDSLVILTDDIMLYKYSLEGKLLFKKKYIDDSSSWLKSDVFLYDGGYFISYYNYDDGENSIILKLNKSGGVVDSISFNRSNDLELYYFYVDNDGRLFLTLRDYYDTDIPYFVVMNSDFEVLYESDLLLEVFGEVSDGYLAHLNSYSENLYVKLDKNYNIVWSKNYNLLFDDEKDGYSYFDTADSVTNGYILLGRHFDDEDKKYAVSMKVDKDGNIMYIDDYCFGSDYSSELNAHKIIVLDNDDYLINWVIQGNVYVENYSSLILKYGYKDYAISTKVLEGKGDIYVVSSGREGDTISYRIEPEKGYQVKSIRITTASGKIIEVNNSNTFTLPDEDVTIEVIFFRETSIVEVPNTAMNAMVFVIIGGLLVTAGGIVIFCNIKKRKAKKN